MKCLVMGLVMIRGQKDTTTSLYTKNICSWTDLQRKNQEVNNCLMCSSMWINNSATNWSQAASYRLKPLTSWFESFSFPSRFQSDKYYLKSQEAVLLASRQLFIHNWMSMCMKKTLSLHPSLLYRSVDPLKSLWLQWSYNSQIWTYKAHWHHSDAKCCLKIIHYWYIAVLLANWSVLDTSKSKLLS